MSETTTLIYHSFNRTFTSMNKLLKICGTHKDCQVGILETPMFPNKFYAGYIKQFGEEWWPSDTGTGYHKTLEDALLTIERIKNILETNESTEMNESELERREQIALDIKKEFTYHRSSGQWFWHDRRNYDIKMIAGQPTAVEMPPDLSGPFSTRLDALRDATDPYWEDSE